MYLFSKSQVLFCGQPSFQWSANRELFPGEEITKHEAHHALLSIVKVMNEEIYTFASHIYKFVARTGTILLLIFHFWRLPGPSTYCRKVLHASSATVQSVKDQDKPSVQLLAFLSPPCSVKCLSKFWIKTWVYGLLHFTVPGFTT